MENKKSWLLIMFFSLIFIFSSVIYAKPPSGLVCTHKVYETDETSKYHYYYCDKCGECNKRVAHTFSYSRYNANYHKAYCSCGYVKYLSHSSSAYKLSDGETVKGTTYSGTETLDKYHKMVCNVCGEVTGVAEHTWTGGNTSAHKCSGCGYYHSKKNDATKGRHYFNIEKIRKAGNVTFCEVCNQYLKLTYSSDSKLTELPKKEEYTMVGNPNPMKEVTLDTDQKIICNFMPINEDGEIIMLDEQYLKVRAYTNGNYYSHYSKLIGNELSKITDRVQYIEDSGTIDYIAKELSSMGALGGYNEEKKQEIINNLEQIIKDDETLTAMDLYAVTGVVSKLGDFAINAIDNPLIDWFRLDLAIKNTWLSGGTYTLRHDFKGTLESSTGREFTIYFSELPDNKYEILKSPLLTEGISFDIYGYSFGGFGNLMYSTLFKKGEGSSDSPANVLAYVSIAYRDTNGNVIYTKGGNLATPRDTVISRVVYSGTSAHSVTQTITAEMNWTQLSGYRYKGYLLKYGNSSAGLYSVYNKPSEMKVTTNASIPVTSAFNYNQMGVSLVFYFEPVNIISVNHKVENELIKTEKNLGKISIPTSTIYDTSEENYAPKQFASLNKNFWPGYILTGYTIYGGSVSKANIIAKKTFDVNTTTKINSKDDAKRYVDIITAITSEKDIGTQVLKPEKIGYGEDKILVFEYLYPEVEINNVNYQTGSILKDINNNQLKYKIKLIGDNMLIKSLDTTPLTNGEYKKLDITLSNETKKSFQYDASNYSLVQAWIYTKDLNKGTKTLYKVIAGNENFVPSKIDESKIQIATDFSSFANYYILDTEELLTVIDTVWADLYIEFRYYEGANQVNVSYVDEEGNVLMPPEVYKILDEVNGKKTTTIPKIDIDGYELKKYVLDDNEYTSISTLENVKIVDNGKDRELVFIYRKDKNDEIYEEEENPYAVIKSNDRENEEYDVNIAMPTDEDLYANVVTDSYILENVLSIMNEQQKVNVRLKKKYYKTSDDNNYEITSEIDTAISTTTLEYILDYQYLGGGNSRLFVLDTAIMENETVMDKKHYDENGKVLMEANYNSNSPFLAYIQGGKLYINNSEECTLVKEEDGIYYLEILLSGVDYEKPNMEQITQNYKGDHTVIDQIIKKNATVNGDFLSVYSENKETIYLNGIEIYMSADRLATALELSQAGYYYIESQAPLTNKNVLFNERKVYTYSQSQNDIYPTTKLTVNYILSEFIEDRIIKNMELEKVSESTLKNLAKSSIDNVVSMYKNITSDCKRTKNYTPSDISMNDISIYTPIVNYTELIPLNNSGDNDNQLIDETKKNVLTLDSVFTVKIPHSGMHVYATYENGNEYDGYGDKEYNFNGAKLNDEKTFADKGLSSKVFSKMKLIKFSFDTYAIKYDKNGTIKDSKLILANTWFNLGELDKNTGMNIENYNFIIPVWVQDNVEGSISVRIVASNIPSEYDAFTTDESVSYLAKDVSNLKDKYILQEDFDVFIAGVLYDLEIRDSDDIGWVGKLTQALKIGNTSLVKNMFLPIGQSNQNKYSGYKYGLKLGYRFYFDLKTKGIANSEIDIIPEYYYVSSDGTFVTKDIALFYNTLDEKYVKLDFLNDLNVKMMMSKTHGDVNNKDVFNFELIKGKLLNETKQYTVQTIIGTLAKGLKLTTFDNVLPRNNILESSKLYGYGANTTEFIQEALKSESIETEEDIRKANGHWYAEFYLPSSTSVAIGKETMSSDVIKNQNLLLNDGYIVVVFKEIKTKSNNEDYLGYAKPTEQSRYEKEGASYLPYEINLPNGNVAQISELEEGVAMAIYEVGIRANDDYETEGTH